MEFLIVFLSIILAIGSVMLMFFMVHDTWAQIKKALQTTELFVFIIFSTFMLALTFAIVLFAFNNTFWHIDYLTTEGLWKK